MPFKVIQGTNRKSICDSD